MPKEEVKKHSDNKINSQKVKKDPKTDERLIHYAKQNKDDQIVKFLLKNDDYLWNNEGEAMNVAVEMCMEHNKNDNNQATIKIDKFRSLGDNELQQLVVTNNGESKKTPETRKAPEAEEGYTKKMISQRILAFLSLFVAIPFSCLSIKRAKKSIGSAEGISLMLVINLLFAIIWMFCVLIPNIRWYNTLPHIVETNGQIFQCLDRKILRKIAKYIILGTINFWKLFCCLFGIQGEDEWHYLSMQCRRYFMTLIVCVSTWSDISLFDGVVPNVIMLVFLLFELFALAEESYYTNARITEKKVVPRLIRVHSIDYWGTKAEQGPILSRKASFYQQLSRLDE